ncbi:Protein-methionine-sulfoxide reductase heme-binding subunit MsrQ [Patescibacteria group bacterium]|nr:Protein-methionine-sulfoxide reductase heme-binding subunit MsrQ [Patescibacteria group bacterium]
MIARLDKLWWGLLFAGLIPLLWLFVDIFLNQLGGNPIEAIHIRLGDWALRFLCVTLAITPIQIMTRWRGLADFRQLFGLYTFFYATLHVLVYVVIDHAFDWSLLLKDILESAYIWFGVLAYIIIFLLGVTSPKAAKKRLGKNWKKLHRFIYLAAAAAIVHYFWQLKSNLIEPIFYLIVIGLLMSFRIL